MSNNNASGTNADSAFVNAEVSMPRVLRFWLMLLANVPSIICTFSLIFYIIGNRTQRYALHNHTILLILLFGLPIQLIDINMYLVFFHFGTILPTIPIMCRIWWLIDYGFYCGQIILMSWLAIERHILIFYDQWISNRRGRFLFHYLPLSILLVYILIFYTTVNFFLPCENVYIYTVPVCGASPCYQSYSIFGMWESIGNSCVPIVFEGIFSIALVIRVTRQKRRLRQSNRWSKQRRMIIQLTLVSALDVSLNTPIFFIPLLRRFGLPSDFGIQPELYFFYFGYFVVFLFPFASLCQYPDLRRTLKRKLCLVCERSHRKVLVEPLAIALPQVTYR
ncbi:unnamed protein product [Adineta ricciae]|uniref:G-protein coupled receptors family 1 profile domain-containing protein n=1 Tax=Adineta ricciae TaxID=249248 RepID=A0A815DMX3_ADIRI|nr:unnamed protein product [Adineta ricciae]